MNYSHVLVVEALFLVLLLPDKIMAQPLARDFSSLLLKANSTIVVGDNRRTLPGREGGEREYLLYLPSGVVDPPAVLLDWHPFLITAAIQKRLTDFHDIADERQNFIVVQPQSSALFNAFNAGDPCCGIGQPIDDVGFAQDILDDIRNNMRIDPRRIYSYGYSQGGGMSNYLAYKIPEQIAAVSTNAFALMPEHYQEALLAKETNPNFHPVPVLAIHGYNDKLFCWERKCLSNIAFPTFNLAKEGWHRWADLNDCVGDPVTLAEKPRDIWSSFSSEHDEYWWIKAYQNCSDNVEVQQILNSNSHIGETIVFGSPGWDLQDELGERIINFLFRWTLPQRINAVQPDWWNE